MHCVFFFSIMASSSAHRDRFYKTFADVVKENTKIINKDDLDLTTKATSFLVNFPTSLLQL